MIVHPRRIGRFHHFRRRVRERIGGHVDADALWKILIEQIVAAEGSPPSPYLKFICRINRDGMRLWRFEIGGVKYFALFDHNMRCPVTVFAAKGTVSRIGKPPLKLEIYA